MSPNLRVQRPTADPLGYALYLSRPSQRIVRHHTRHTYTHSCFHAARIFPREWPPTPTHLTKMYHHTKPQTAPRTAPTKGIRKPGQPWTTTAAAIACPRLKTPTHVTTKCHGCSNLCRFSTKKANNIGTCNATKNN